MGEKEKNREREREIVDADDKYKTPPDEQESKDKTSEWTVKIIIKLVQLWWSLFDFSWKLLLHEEVGESGDEADDDYLEK